MTKMQIHALLALLAGGCGPQAHGTFGADSLDDVQTITQRSDGNFDVVCKDGRTEVNTQAQISSNQLCLARPPCVHVPGDYASVQGAVDAGSSVICLDAWDPYGVSVTTGLVSISGTSPNFGLSFVDVEKQGGISLSKVTVLNGTTLAGSGKSKIVGCVLRGPNAYDRSEWPGDAVRVMGGALASGTTVDVEITGCDIQTAAPPDHGNNTPWALRVDTGCTVAHVSIHDNVLHDSLAGLMLGLDSYPTSQGPLFGCYSADNTGTVTVAGNRIENMAGDGLGIWYTSGSGYAVSYDGNVIEARPD